MPDNRWSSFETAASRPPCISASSRRRGKVGAAVADGSPQPPRVYQPAPELGAPSAASLSPNSRQGRQASPHAQGRDMEHFVGIDVAKDRLDVHLRPSGESFTVTRDGEGLVQLVDRLQRLAPRLVVMEATGGYETIVASAVAAAHPPLAGGNPPPIRDFARAPRTPPQTHAIHP